MKNLKTLVPVFMAGILMLFCFQGCKEIDPDVNYVVNPDSVKVHRIPLSDARNMTASFKRERITLARQLKDPNYLDKSFNLPEGEKFNKDAILALLNQRGANGVRIYMGRDNKGLVRMVLVGVDIKGKDILPARRPSNAPRMQNFYGGQEQGLVMESGQRCPTMCSLGSAMY